MEADWSDVHTEFLLLISYVDYANVRDGELMDVLGCYFKHCVMPLIVFHCTSIRYNLDVGSCVGHFRFPII